MIEHIFILALAVGLVLMGSALYFIVSIILEAVLELVKILWGHL
jgi:hypothetical protein